MGLVLWFVLRFVFRILRRRFALARGVDAAAVFGRIGHRGLQRERAVVFGDRLVVASLLCQNIAAVVGGVGARQIAQRRFGAGIVVPAIGLHAALHLRMLALILALPQAVRGKRRLQRQIQRQQRDRQHPAAERQQRKQQQCRQQPKAFI